MSGSTGIVTFDYAAWALAYPQFAATVNQTQAQTYFNLATQYCDNTTSSPITDYSVGGQRETALYLLTAHIAQLFSGSSIEAASGVVGRISSATEGSVSVSVEMPAPTSELAGWMQQTQFGLMYWAMTGQFRTFRPNPRGVPFNQLGNQQTTFPIPWLFAQRYL